MLLSALGLNRKHNLFCEHLCPGGAVQRLLFKLSPKAINLPAVLQYVKYVSPALVIFIIIATKNTKILSYNFLGMSLSRIALVKLKALLGVTFLLSIVMSLLIYRPFCRYLCPVAALNSAISFFTNIIRRGRAPNNVV